MTIRSALLALVLTASTAAAQQAPPFAVRDAPDDAFRERVAVLIHEASEPGQSPRRQAARDALFREVKPRLLSIGASPSPADAEGLRRALTCVPCVSGRPKLVRAVVYADIAYVAASGERGGGCTYLLRRDGDRWVELLPLGWTLNA